VVYLAAEYKEVFLSQLLASSILCEYPFQEDPGQEYSKWLVTSAACAKWAGATENGDRETRRCSCFHKIAILMRKIFGKGAVARGRGQGQGVQQAINWCTSACFLWCLKGRSTCLTLMQFRLPAADCR